MKAFVTCVTTLAAGGVCLAQTGVLDQESPWNPPAPIQSASFNLDAPSLTWQQQVRAGVAGQLEGMNIPMVGAAGATMTLKIRIGPAWASSPEVFTTQVVKAVAGTEVAFINMTAANIQLAAGDVFVFETQGNGTGMNILGSYAPPASTPAAAYPEPLYLNSNLFVDDRWRHGFQTYMLGGAPSCYANCDGSTVQPILNVSDFTCFLQRYAAGESYANCDGSTVPPVLNVADFTCFLQRYAAGCP